LRAKNINEIKNALLYLAEKANTEWLTQSVYDFVSKMQDKGNIISEMVDVISGDEKLMHVAKHVNKLMVA